MNPIDTAIQSGQIRDDPYPLYARLRRDHPIVWSDAWRCWVLSRYDDVAAVMQDARRFTNAGRVVSAIRREFKGNDLEQVRPLVDHYSLGLINSDPPDHTRMRRLVQNGFVPRVVDALKPHIQQIVDDLLDRAQRSGGQMDVVRDLSYPLPIQVIAELMGIPLDMRDQFKAWSVQIIEFQATPRPPLEVALRSQKALLELRAFFKEIFEERRRSPRSDLISILVQASFEGEKLTLDELLNTCVTILIGGHETTTSLIASGVWLILTHPDVRRQITEEPSLASSAVEEFLRYEPPFQRIIRIATEDLALAGTSISRGQTVMLLIGSANRDQRVFESPEALNIRRSPNRHLSFGYGVHFCLGAGLARAEAPIAIGTLLRRFPNLRLDVGPPQWHDGMVRCLTRVSLAF